ncbi:hypothetical protein AB0B50_43430 [Streptomyces sp. NPDC041068]|uniref:hypothetical protein n=1 Tax=Streptomyces sp. NPDC041068 TaxID=3155130 RepID=UPI0033E14B85
MKTGNALLNEALTLGERSESHTTRLGGVDMRRQVESWSLDQSYATDLPEAMRAFSGVSSAQLDLSLTGTGGSSAPALYGPWAPRSTGDAVRPGQSVTHGWGINGYREDAFRGAVRSRSAESATDLVRVSALDGAERLRQPAQLPRPDGAFNTNPGATWSNWAASPVWVVDHLLRKAGIHTAPPPRPTSILHVPFHGGAAASLGYMESMGAGWDFWQKESVPFESAVEGGFDSLTTATYIPALLPVTRRSDGLWFEVWTDNTGNLAFNDSIVQFQSSWEASAGGTTYYTALRVNFTQGTITAYNGTNADPTKNQSVGWVWEPLKTWGTFHIGLWLTFSTSGVPTFVPVVTPKDQTPAVLNVGTLANTPIPAGAMVTTSFGVQNMRAECFQVSQHTARPSTVAQITQAGTWKRTASLDKPVFPLRAIPNVNGSAWDVITEIARATLATAEFDSDGYFKWRNHTRWATAPTTADLTVTSKRELGKLTVTEEIDACRNHCTVKWENWARVKAGYIDTVRDSPAPIAIAAGATITRTIGVDDDMLDPRAPRTPDTAGAGSPNRIIIRATSAATSAVVAGAVEVRVTRAGGLVTLTARNRSASTVYYHGAALLSLLVSDSKPVPSLWSAWNTISQGYYGVQTYEHDVRGWIQDVGSGIALAEALREAGVYPPPLLQSVEILADPRIELGDVVRVVDRTGAQLDTLAWVIGIKTTGSGGRVTQTLTLRGTTPNGVPKDEGLTPDPPTANTSPPP